MKRVCGVCGTTYETCYSCERDRSWRTLTDTKEHYFILGVLMDYQSDHNAARAYQRLRRRNVDLLAAEKYTEDVRKLMAEIYAMNHRESPALTVSAEEQREAKSGSAKQIQKGKREDAEEK